MDARAQRTRHALHQAVLRLAAEHDVVTLSVAQLARAAQINRVTFYNHAKSPATLLTAALQGELDAVRAGILDSGTQEVTSRPAVALTEHLVAYLTVYQRNLPVTGQGVLADFLSGHFAQSVHLVFAENRSSLRNPAQNHITSADTVNAAAQFISRGVIGIIAVWLHSSPRPDQEQLVMFFDQLLPTWWLDLVQETAPLTH